MGGMASSREATGTQQPGKVRLAIFKGTEQIRKWRANNVNQVSPCRKRKVQICKGIRLG